MQPSTPAPACPNVHRLLEDFPRRDSKRTIVERAGLTLLTSTLQAAGLATGPSMRSVETGSVDEVGRQAGLRR
jgi:hypothetical protein